MQQSELDFIQSLRQSSHYIEQHRGKTCVIYLPGTLLEQQTHLTQLAQDLTLLHNLGLNLVLAMGAAQQLDQALQQRQLNWQTHLGCRVTPTEILPIVQQTIGQVRSQVEAVFCQISVKQMRPMSVVSGNWVIAQPKGVIDGVDYQHTGKLRKVNIQAIRACIDSGQIALVTPLAYSLTGEVFNLNTFEQACEIARLLKADKLMIFDDPEQLGITSRQLSRLQFEQIMPRLPKHKQPQFEQLLSISSAVPRIHILQEHDISSLLLELFTRDGSGLMIFNDHYHQLRQAQHEDIPAIIALISPLEERGILVKRSREKLELEIEHFNVVERDGEIIACAALYIHDNDSQPVGEVACLAVSNDYQGQQLGEQLLLHLETLAQQHQITQLFLLTTHTHHWFIEHGFHLGKLEDLPPQKQALYNYQRQSKVLIKPLSNS